MVSMFMMAAGGFDGLQTLICIAHPTVAGFNTVADNASTGDNQSGCGLLLVCGGAIRQAIWSKELPACMIGKRYLIDRGDLDRFIDARPT
jgi:excisionase family DNA binding protein